MTHPLSDPLYKEAEELAQLLVLALSRMKKTLVLAESCTGGQIADSITQVPGSSNVFWGGWVVYSPEAKASQIGVASNLISKKGVVSAEVAEAMAKGALARIKPSRKKGSLKAPELALSTTGIAGPTGGTRKTPVGLCFIGLARKGKPTLVRKIQGPPGLGRSQYKKLFATEALKLLLENLEMK